MDGLFYSSVPAEQSNVDRSKQKGRTRERETDWHREAGKRLSQMQFEVPRATESELAFRHSGWAVDRARVLGALVSIQPGSKRAERFANCGADARVEVHVKTGKARVRSFTCGDRFCKVCGVKTKLEIRDMVKSLEGQGQMRHLTLTLREDGKPLAERLNRLMKSFRRLRQQKVCEGFIKCGVYAVEIKRNMETKNWHCHLHVLICGGYLSHERLSKAWFKATGDSTYVYIKAIQPGSKHAAYIAKYAGKVVDQSVLHDPDSLQEAILALRGRRMFGTVGMRFKRDGEYQPSPKEDWKRMGRLDECFRKANEGCEWSNSIIQQLKRSEEETLFDDPGKADLQAP